MGIVGYLAGVGIEQAGQPVAEGFGNDIDVGAPTPLRKRRSYGWLVWLVVLLAVIGGGGAYAWMNFDRIAEITHAATAAASGDAPAAASNVTTEDFEAYQQQAAASLQAANDQVAAQQAELKRLSDAVEGLTGRVATLTARLEQAQAGPTPAAPAAVATTGSTPRAANASVTPAQAPSAPRRRPPAVSRPAGAVSVGGAPLSEQPAR